MTRTAFSPLLATALAAAFLNACDQANTPPPNTNNSTNNTSNASGSNTTTPTWILAAAPADAVPVATLKASATEGQHVVIRGRIGGRADPISADSPVLIIMDPALASCADIEGDTCATPWDYCCETPASIAANNATIQVVDAAGEPITGSLAAAGLEPLAEIIVVGVVAARPDPSVLTIRATGIHRVTP